MLKTLLMKTPLYDLARTIYRALVKPELAAEASRMRDFYRQFIKPGDLVIDVGAHSGEYTEVFLKCGARVIAVEPNPAWHDRLNRLARSSHGRTVLAFKAIGSRPGLAVLNICSVPGYSTLLAADADWMKASPDYAQAKWINKVEVEVTTLDELLAGSSTVPAFVKIDVEGFELEVLKGMTCSPRALSFEFGARRKDVPILCIKRLAGLGYRFRPIVGRDYIFTTTDWMGEMDALSWLDGFTTESGEYGDMFARL